MTGAVRTLPVTEGLAGAGPAPAAQADAQTVAPGEGTLTLAVVLPDGYHPNDLDTGALTLSSTDAGVAQPASDGPQPVAYPTTFDVVFSPSRSSGRFFADGLPRGCTYDAGLACRALTFSGIIPLPEALVTQPPNREEAPP